MKAAKAAGEMEEETTENVSGKKERAEQAARG